MGNIDYTNVMWQKPTGELVRIAGSPEALKWNMRDLPGLHQVIKRTKTRRVALQAGGHFGIWPKRLSQDFRLVYTFEPAPDLFTALVRNVPEPHVIKMQAALGYDRGTVGLSRQRRDGKPNIHEGITHVSGAGPCPVLRIDDLGLTVCDLICLDLEGYELQALKGAVETLRRCRPILTVEINKNAGFMGYTREDVLGLIEACGYDTQPIFAFHSDVTFKPKVLAA